MCVFELTSAISKAEKKWWKIIFVFKYWEKFKINTKYLYSLAKIWEDMEDDTHKHVYIWVAEKYNWEIEQTKEMILSAINFWETGKHLILIFKRYADKNH